MLPYQERVVAEKKELDDKISRLAKFIGSPEHDALGAEDKDILGDQMFTMNSYSEILRYRIQRF